MKTLIKFINTKTNIDKKSAAEFNELAVLKNYSKGALLSKAGEMQSNFYLLKSGIVRSYYSDENGKTHIRNFFTKEMSTTGDVGSLATGKVGKLSYDCLTDCTLYAINFLKFKDIAKRNHSFSIFYSSLLTVAILALESKIYDLSVLNGTERYLKLKKQISGIENLIPQYHIASFLNITPVQLSRIRKDLLKKNK
jgi:CRP-like cAMP-binding protein